MWSLHLEQEFVYVGDAGIVEPSGRSRRFGIEVGARYQFNDWLYGYTDMNLNFKAGNWTYGIIVENLFDIAWNETQFATESRLFNETEAVEEIHFTPGTPFFLRGKISVKF